MKKFLINTGLFLLIFIVIGEVYVRVFRLNIDVPTSYMDKKDKLIKFGPNEIGYHILGHQWQTNDYGYTGNNPKEFDNLITVVGDSYIAGFMNPNECHQSVLLQKLRPEFNFFPMARQGTGVLEHLERIKSVDSLKPLLNLVFVEEKSFMSSIREFDKLNSTLQVSLKNKKLFYPKHSGGKLKEMLREFKLGYYFYRQFVLKKKPEDAVGMVEKPVDYKVLPSFLDYIVLNYDLSNVVFVFRPDVDPKFVLVCQEKGLKVFSIQHDGDYKSWSFETDNHWSCVGHEKASKQVSKFLEEYQF